MRLPLDPAMLPAPSRCPSQADLPDPFETFAGETVDTAEAWAERRAELRHLFAHYVYGYAPPAPDVATETDRTTGVLDGRADLTEVRISFPELADDAPTITTALFTPTGVDDRSVPVVLVPNGAGNHAAVADAAVTVPPAAREHGVDAEQRGALDEAMCVGHVLDRDYGFATFHVADVDPDSNDLDGSIRSYYDPPGPPGTEWGSIAAWAWGLQRCVDALRSEERVRADEIAVTGHSRGGKAALLAGAFDDRIALVAPHQSGLGGCVPARDTGQETVADITESFPHWFSDTYAAFSGQVERLPVDQHLLIALVAPRPLIATDGARDYWADPGRALDSLRAADPVYDLLGVQGVVDDGLLHGEDEITEASAGRLLQYRRETGHRLDRGYWDAILDFADVHFEG